MERRWDIQHHWQPWVSFGFHLDHTDPSITFHLPFLVVAIGRLKQPGFRKVQNERSTETQPEERCCRSQE